MQPLTIKEIQDIIYANTSDNLLKINPDLQLNQNIEIVTAFANAVAPLYKQVIDYAILATKQGTPLTAESIRDNPEMGMLEFWGRWRLGRDPNVASFGKYAIEVTGTGTLKAGTILTNQATNLNYIIDTDVTIKTATIINVTSADKGTAAALAVNDTLQFNQAFTGIGMIATVKTVLFNPIDNETIDEYRRKIIDTLKIQPRGSAVGDYYLYAQEVAGVYKAYPYSGNFLGSAVIYIRADANNATDNNGTPPPALIDDVKQHCITYGSLTAASIDYRPIVIRKYYINLVGVANSLKAKVSEIVKDYFDNKEPFIVGIDDVANMDKEQISKSELYGKILIAISPAIIGDITINVDDVAANNKIITPDLTANFGRIFGSTATNEQYINLSINNIDKEFKITTAQSANDLIQYAQILHNTMIADGVAVDVSGGNKLIFKNIDIASTSALGFKAKATATGIDLSDAQHLGLATAEIVAIGTITKINDISSETLPQGNIPTFEVTYT